MLKTFNKYFLDWGEQDYLDLTFNYFLQCLTNLPKCYQCKGLARLRFLLAVQDKALTPKILQIVGKNKTLIKNINISASKADMTASVLN